MAKELTAPSVPLVTVGLPVYNGEEGVETTLRSLMAQDFERLEILVVDNASIDATGTICRDLSSEDSRVRYVRNESNIGQNRNFTRVFELSKGRYFRWIGNGDSVEPGYVSACCGVLDHNDSASLVTTHQRHITDDGAVLLEPYDGPRPTSTDPIDRLDAMLSLLTGNHLWIDPVYSMTRRAALESTGLIRPFRFGDELLACELALWGPFEHIDSVLSNRVWAPLPRGVTAFRRYARIGRARAMDVPLAAIQRPLMQWLIWKAMRSQPDLDAQDRVRGVWALGKYSTRLLRRRYRRISTRLRRSR